MRCLVYGLDVWTHCFVWLVIMAMHSPAIIVPPFLAMVTVRQWNRSRDGEECKHD